MTTGSSIDLLIPHTEPKLYARLLEIIQNKKIIFLCLAFSIVIHILFLIRFSGLESKHNTNTPVSRSIDIELNRYMPEKAPEIQKKVKPIKRKIIKNPKPAPKPVEKKIVAPEKKQAVVEESITQEEPVEELVKEIIEEKQTLQSQVSNAPEDPALMVSEKKQYLETIAAHLSKHKFYPRSARRRHIEGEVKVSFDLLPDGNILNLKIFSGHTILQKAASESISSSLPMPQRPDSLLALNIMNIEYTMKYALK